MNITPENLDTIETSFGRPSPNIKTKPCRIKFRGKFITTASRKTVWRNKGFAKSALLNHFQSDYNVCQLTGGYGKCKEWIRELESQNIVEYVDVDIDQFAQQKD